MLSVLSTLVQHSQHKKWAITPKDLAILECVSQAIKSFIVGEKLWSLTYYPAHKIRLGNMEHLANLKARGVNFDRDVTVVTNDIMYYISQDDPGQRDELDEPFKLDINGDNLRGIKEIFPDACIQVRGVFCNLYDGITYEVDEDMLHFIDKIMKSYDIAKVILDVDTPNDDPNDCYPPPVPDHCYYQWIPGSPPSLDQRIPGSPPEAACIISRW